MMGPRFKLPDSLTIKLASLVVHIEEFMQETDPQTADFDLHAIKGLLLDPEVREFLDHPRNTALLPVKRSKKGRRRGL